MQVTQTPQPTTPFTWPTTGTTPPRKYTKVYTKDNEWNRETFYFLGTVDPHIATLVVLKYLAQREGAVAGCILTDLDVAESYETVTAKVVSTAPKKTWKCIKWGVGAEGTLQYEVRMQGATWGTLGDGTVVVDPQ